MSSQLTGEAWKADLQSIHKLIMLAMADQANDEGFVRASNKDLAKRCGSHPEQISEIISHLEQFGWIKVIGDGWLQLIVSRDRMP